MGSGNAAHLGSETPLHRLSRSVAAGAIPQATGRTIDPAVSTDSTSLAGVPQASYDAWGGCPRRPCRHLPVGAYHAHNNAIVRLARKPARRARRTASSEAWVDLEHYRVTGYQNRSKFLRALWYAVSLVVFESGLPFPSSVKRGILRSFRARIGTGAVVKPHVRIKFPWQLAIGNHSWIGEGTWIDNLAEVRIGSHVCISQGVYFCTGSHDHRKRDFDLLTAPITVADGAWVAARSTLIGGVTIGANALVAAGSLVRRDVDPAAMVGGNPAVFIRHRDPPGDAC